MFAIVEHETFHKANINTWQKCSENIPHTQEAV